MSAAGSRTTRLRPVADRQGGRAARKLGGGLSLRGAVNTGFRAPSLQQLWFSNVSTQFLPDATGALQPTQVLTSNNQSPVTKAFGIPKLHEEKSTNLSGGLAYRPLDNLSITADGYFIRIKDRIVLTSQFSNTNPIVAEHPHAVPQRRARRSSSRTRSTPTRPASTSSPTTRPSCRSAR